MRVIHLLGLYTGNYGTLYIGIYQILKDKKIELDFLRWSSALVQCTINKSCDNLHKSMLSEKWNEKKIRKEALNQTL